MFSLENSVGAAGRNLPHDVALVQVALKILHRGQNGSGPYYKGAVTGRMDGPTTGAIRLFFKHFADEVQAFHKIKINQSSPVFKPYDAMHRELIFEVQGNSIWRDLSVIRGTPILYLEGKRSSPRKLAEEFLIPARMKPERAFYLGDEVFDTQIDAVYLSVFDKFVVEYSFPKIAALVSPTSLLAKPVFLSGPFGALVKKNLPAKGWKLKTDTAPKVGLFSIQNETDTGILKTAWELENKQVLRRILLPRGTAEENEGFRFAARIPSYSQAAQLAQKIQYAVCAGPGVAGNEVKIREETNRITQEIVKGAPTVRADTIGIHCTICKDLGARINQSRKNLDILARKYTEGRGADQIRRFEYHLRVLSMVGEAGDASQLAHWLSTLSSIPKIPIPLDGDKLAEGVIEPGLDDEFDAAAGAASAAAKYVAAKYPAKAALLLTLRIASRAFLITGAILTIYDILSFAWEQANKDKEDPTLGRQIQILANEVTFRKEIREARDYMATTGKFLQEELRQHRLELENASLVLHGDLQLAEQQKCGDGFMD